MLDRLSLDGKVVVITGGGTGLGLAMVRALARAGANLVIAGRRQGPIDDAVSEVKGLGGDAMAVYPSQTLSGAEAEAIGRYTHRIAQEMGFKGLMNGQCIVMPS